MVADAGSMIRRTEDRGSRPTRTRDVRARLRALGAALACASVAGCAQPNLLYRWGTYEDSLYQNMVRRTEDPATQALRLSQDVARTEAEGKKVPPGVHAHLGWLLHVTGDSGGARAHLEAEKTLFPESAAMVDRMLARLQGAAPGPQPPTGVTP